MSVSGRRKPSHLLYRMSVVMKESAGQAGSHVCARRIHLLLHPALQGPGAQEISTVTARQYKQRTIHPSNELPIIERKKYT